MNLRLIIVLILFPWVAVAAGFLSVYEDLPLASGLHEVPGSALSFDSQEGRIVEVDTTGPARSSDILDFYASTLPHLGWVEDSPTQFHREQEVLRLEVGHAGHDLVSVKFKISPK